MTSATSCGRSSWTTWPQRANTWSWNLPCIWPTVNVRSSPSMLANSSNFGTRRSRNFWLRFANHPDQYFSDFDKSMRHAYLFINKNRLCSNVSIFNHWVKWNYFLSIGERCCRSISDELVVSSSESSEIVSGLMKIVAAVGDDGDVESLAVAISTRGNSFVANFPVKILHIKMLRYN